MSSYDEMNRVLDEQKKFFINNGSPSIKLRIDRLERLKALIMNNRYDFIDALNADFGVRSKNASMLSDVYGILPAINQAIKNVKKWNKIEKKSSNFPFGLLGAKSYIKYEPLGTVGMISPWNFPVNLTFVPLVSIFAAGNQVMHKPSEHTPITSTLLKDLCDKSYDQNEFATFLGGPEVGEAFTKLHFDHLLYTGGGSVAKHVMNAASKNLVPCTLELGGKSPVIIGKSADLKTSAKRIMFGKTMNAGQICLAPDYVVVHKNQKEDFINETKEAVNEYFPDLKDNDDYTSIINQKHYDRLQDLLSDAIEKGAKVDAINPANEDFSQQEFYKIPPTIITNTTDDMKVMQEEIFGPLLPIVEYDDIDEATQLINSKDRPLGLYYFGNDKSEENNLLNKTSSGGVTVNNVISHLQQDNLSFGGVGPSGMGRYKSFDGFKNFSNPRAYYKEVGYKFDKFFNAVRPPYKGDIEKILKQLFK
ncbi:MAG: coniferyl aldehyde dehydrogenase [Gammaproteobacteria bacterium TMED226]|nr:MAG: coniferyl aldehyde dehydrogenase [Gammaproteobacteria bacterium TMED226]|tara:strand:+ start:11543 stop:12970 length:1428 start_codon:yes stop_codon:yes gene_type:complete